MKKTFLKRIVSIITGVTLLSSLSFTGVSAFELTQDFESGLSLPWYTQVNDAAEIEFDTSSGAAEITIINPGGRERGGEDRWDIEFLFNNIRIIAGYEYEVSWEITASNDGQYYTCIRNESWTEEYWNNNWELRPLKANEKTVITEKFTPNRSCDLAEWTFQFGGAGEYTSTDCFPVGTVITIDNISLSIPSYGPIFGGNDGYRVCEYNNVVYGYPFESNDAPAEVVKNTADHPEKYAVILDNINGHHVERIANDIFGYTIDSKGKKVKIDGYTIYGELGSAAEKYAIDNEINFVPIGSSTIKGDLNGNGFIRATDLQLMKSGLTKGEFAPNSDMNGDGKVNVFDLVSQKKEFINTNNKTFNLDINYTTYKIDPELKWRNANTNTAIVDYPDLLLASHTLGYEFTSSFISDFGEKYDREYFKTNSLILALYEPNEKINEYKVNEFTLNNKSCLAVDIVGSSSASINDNSESAHLVVIEVPWQYGYEYTVRTILSE